MHSVSTTDRVPSKERLFAFAIVEENAQAQGQMGEDPMNGATPNRARNPMHLAQRQQGADNGKPLLKLGTRFHPPVAPEVECPAALQQGTPQAHPSWTGPFGARRSGLARASQKSTTATTELVWGVRALDSAEKNFRPRRLRRRRRNDRRFWLGWYRNNNSGTFRLGCFSRRRSGKHCQ